MFPAALDMSIFQNPIFLSANKNHSFDSLREDMYQINNKIRIYITMTLKIIFPMKINYLISTDFS